LISLATGTRLDLVTIRWFVVIVGYGTLIPNTWRRCLTATCLFGATFMAALTAQALFNGVDFRGLVSLLLYPLVWTTVATVIAVFGSYRVSLLERRVYDAQRLGQYRLVRHLGAGGMGEVFLAEHVLLKQPFAIKLLRPDRVSDPAVLQRFEREVHAMARLEHWNTVEIYDFGHGADGSFYYVMEYLPGLDLHQLVKTGGAVPAPRAIHLLRQVCAALQEAHANGLLHRDIKPGNVIVCERAGIYDVAKLLDFGLVKSVSSGADDTTLTQEGMVAGTPAYMSPEQASGMENADARSDIYSLGAVAYYLLTGRLLFVKDTAMQTLAAHLYEPVVPPSRHNPTIDPTIEAVVMRCLEKKPEDRYPDVAAPDRALSSCPGCGEWTQKDAATWWKAQGPKATTGS
jgi:eukaryotic-like serine/threonine-protein kinase